ncbi:hypothetical protein AXF42_Ash020424 [Apostasia shenzhenica]|uniref:Uncharacterized protein n=1 Tax=Apostasia shenzhenica TaxID=1088818 RepID=A0A2H9ZYI6_9ASPA|nr:hypothetical protein AXF42_Ash020424 [Apostasia shenzhenica]
MENFNSKLYEKYNNLKKRKFAEVEERNQKRNVDVAKYQSAVEGLIEDLKNENDKLRAEMVSIQEEFHECQQLLLQERHKTKMLSNGVETLKHLLLQENNDDRAPLMSPHRSPIVRLDDSNEFLQKGNMEGTQNAVVVKDASIITNGMTNEKTIMYFTQIIA